MKKALICAVAIIALLIAVPMILSSCSDEPYYYLSDIRYDPEAKVITWYDNTDATEWTVTINGSEYTTSSRQFSYDAGTASFWVTITTKNATENRSNSSQFEYLEPVSGLKIENGVLKWNPVSGADYYEVYNNGHLQNNVDGCSYILSPGAFNVYVKPASSNYNYFTYKSESLEGVVLSSPTNLTYENGVFRWAPAEGADYYTVSINGKEYTTNLCEYNFAGTKQDIHISVSSGSNAANSYVSTPLEATCYYLSPITTYSFNEQGELVWPLVENATGYSVNINGQDVQTSGSNFYSDIELDTVYTVKVTPHGGFSYTDEPIAYTFEKLSAVEGVTFANGIVSWNTHTRAKSYEIMVNGELYTTNTNSYSLGTPKETLEIQVFALGEIENSRSYMAHTTSFTYIPMVSNIRIEDGNLVWDASEGASGYTIKFNNGTTNSTQDTAYSNIIANQQYVVKIRPEAALESYYTYDSAEFTFTILEAPYVTYQQGVFRWNGSSDAKGYAFKVVDPDGKVTVENIAGNQLTKSYNFTTPGKYTVEVKAVADPANENVYDSKYSTTINVTQLADVAGHTVVNDINSTSYVQIIANAVADATGYKVSVNGNEVSTPTSNTFSLDLLSLLPSDNSETTFKIAIKAIGTVSSNNVVLDSKNFYEFNLIRLAAPQNVVINGNKISWNNVSNANKYLIFIDGKSYECTSSEYTLTALSAGEHKVTVQAINSDSQTFIPSRYSNELKINKLKAPTNVRLDNGGENLIIKWDMVTGSTGYQLKIGSNSSDPIKQTSYNISTHASSLNGGEGTQITVYAMGNGSNIIESEPSATITIARLNAPTGLSVTGDNITWNPSEVDGIKATSYILYIDGVEYPVSGTSYSTSELSEGTHTVQVVAVGSISDQRYTINSPKAGAITVTKFAQVTNVTVSGNSYSWDAVNGAEYRVTVDGVEYFTSQPTLAVDFDTVGTHTVTIQAYSKQPNTVASTPVVISQQVSAISTPKFKKDADPATLNDYDFTLVRNGDTITIQAKANSEIVTVGYEFYVEGIVTESTTGIYNYEIRDSYDGCEYTIKMKFTAKGFGTDGVYYIDSAFSEDVIFTYTSNQ